MSITMGLLNLILALILIVGVIAIGFMIANKIYGATNTTIQKSVTSVPNITPTTPDPNLQYLPQKAYVQAFAPENGVPNTPTLTPLPQGTVAPIQAQPIPQQQQSIGGFDIASIMSMVVAAGSGLLAKVGLDKAKKSEDLTKTNMSATITSKEGLEQLAREFFKSLPQKGNEITDAPAIKLETLNQEKKDLADTAAKA